MVTVLIIGIGSTPSAAEKVVGWEPAERLYETITSSPMYEDAMVSCRFDTYVQERERGHAQTVLASAHRALAESSELVWVHYVGPVDLDFTVRPGSRGAEPVRLPALTPGSDGPLPVTTMLDAAALSPASAVLVSLDIAGESDGVLDALPDAAAGLVSPSRLLLAGEPLLGSKSLTDLFTDRLSRGGALSPESMVDTLVELTGRRGLVLPRLLDRQRAEGTAMRRFVMHQISASMTPTEDGIEVSVRSSSDEDLMSRSARSGSVDDVMKMVGTVYLASSPSTTTVGSRPLLEVGEGLFDVIDTPDRLLSAELGDQPHAVLRVEAPGPLRHLPWELLASSGRHLAVERLNYVVPVRSVPSPRPTRSDERANRPLTVLFMAASAEGVRPELDFEHEESMILHYRSRAGLDVVVEEQGSLDGLRDVIDAYGPHHFDILHISGHASIVDDEPVLVLEDDRGERRDATADDLGLAVDNAWPRLIFLSACQTAETPQEGALASMCERLVLAGAPAVLGWALPVGDADATVLASALYERLAAGKAVPEATALSRRRLFEADSPYWHTLRLYADPSPLGPLVTPLNTVGRRTSTRLPAAEDFLDHNRVVKVADRRSFIGRRRVIQRCLRALVEPVVAGGPQVLLIHGMGGLGKSTLASRILDRLSEYQRAVHVGAIGEGDLPQLFSRLHLPDPDQAEAINDYLSRELPLEQRLRYILAGPLAAVRCLFVFDDFENGNLVVDSTTSPENAAHLTADAALVVSAFGKAIRTTNSPSRLIVTSRYAFPTPAEVVVQQEGLETLNAVELRKKLSLLDNLRGWLDDQGVRTLDQQARARGVEAAAGNPRLLEWIDRLVPSDVIDLDAVLTAIEGAAVEFRTDVLAEQLLDAVGAEGRAMLAKLNVVDLPVPIGVVRIVAEVEGPDTLLQRSVELGLIERGLDPRSREHRYHVSNVLTGLLGRELTESEHRTACARAAEALFDLWVKPNARWMVDDDDENS